MRGKGLLQPRGLGLAAPLLCCRRTVEQAGRESSRYQIQRRKTIDHIFLVPGPYYWAMAFDP